jgi:uncharacterized protein (DUF2225 family)
VAIRSTTALGQDTDFRPHTIQPYAIAYDIHVCPECYFAAFEGDFGYAEPQVRRLILSGELHPEEVVGEERGGILYGSTKYLLAARCYEHDRRATRLRLADLYLRAAWCARLEGRREREREAQTEAVLRFEEAVEEGEVEPAQLQVILYLIGELYRRLGLFALALKFFDRAAAEAEESDPAVLLLIQRQRAAAAARRADNMTVTP